MGKSYRGKLRILALLVSLIMAANLAACNGGGGSATTAPPAQTEAAATEAPTTAAQTTTAATTTAAPEPAGGPDPNAILQLHYNNDFSNLDPALTSDGQGGILGFMMPPLMDVNADYSLAPGIADSYTVDDTSTIYTFHIPDGIKFHDGTACDAEAVKWNYSRQLKENATPEMPYAQTIFGNVVSIEAPDKNTVVFTLAEADGTLATYLAMANGCGLVSPTAWQADPEGFRRNPVGAGPYIFEEWVSDQYIKMKANPNYFRGPVQNAGVVMRVIKDNAVAISEFITGGLDYMGLAASDVSQAERNGYTVYSRPAAGFSYVVFADYEHNEIFKDKNVREAVYHAMDIAAMVKGVYQGMNEQSHGVVPPSMVGGDKQPTIPEYDPALAEKMLDEAGYPKDENGVRFSFSYISRNEAWNTQMAVAIQMELDKIGVKANVMPLPRPEWLNKGMMDPPDYDTVGRNWGAAANDTSYMCQLFLSDNAVAGGLNIPKWKSPEFDALVAEARRTGDIAKQAELYAKAAQVLNDDIPVIWLEQHANMWVSQPNLIDPDHNIGWNGVNYWWKIGKEK